MFNRSDVIPTQCESWSALEVLKWAFDEFNQKIAIASAFGPEGLVIVDIATHLQPDLKVFIIDTGFLFPETHSLIQKIETRYSIKVERIQPLITPDQQAEQHGAALWKRDPDRCCQLRKVEPLKLRLANLRAWITGIRREQSPMRGRSSKVSWDEAFDLVKVNPLADWTSTQVWEYIRQRNLAYNALHDRHYPSIGCTHCTSAIRPGDPQRSGRWPGFEKTECGLHQISLSPKLT